MNKRALLIGNGINLLDSSQSVSWGDLLAELRRNFGISVEIDNEFKPFPLGFEEMIFEKRGSLSTGGKIKNLKQEIRQIIERQIDGKNGYNSFHKKIMSVKYDDFLTTNYDYALEQSAIINFTKEKSKYALDRREVKYSLKRRYSFFHEDLRKTVWHIHGELSNSRNISNEGKNYKEESIMIGYRHYASYLEKIQEAVKGKRNRKKTEEQGIVRRLKSNNSTLYYWTDIFFTHDLDIVGFGMDFSENHLWWLLNHRANLIRNNLSESAVIDNKIRFYYPDKQDNYTRVIDEKETLEKRIKRINFSKKSKAIADVLKSFKVTPVAIQCVSYNDFYTKFLNAVKLQT